MQEINLNENLSNTRVRIVQLIARFFIHQSERFLSVNHPTMGGTQHKFEAMVSNAVSTWVEGLKPIVRARNNPIGTVKITTNPATITG
jgi:hypothetical protein